MNSSIKPIIDKIEELFKTFNTKFYDGQLQKPVLTVSPDSTSGAFGWITTWKSWHQEGMEEGFYEINLCAEHLNRDFKETCATLLHEMVHLWNLQNDVKDTSRGTSYHNKKFKEVGEQRGLIIKKHDKYGWTLTSLNEEATEFINTLGEQNFQLHRTKMTKLESGAKKSSSKKYTCPQCGMIVRATKEVHILCGDCDVKMELEEN